MTSPIGPLALGLALLALLALGLALWHLRRPKFGALPKGGRLARIRRSPNFSGQIFVNRLDTSMWTGESSRLDKFAAALKGSPGRRPDFPLPSAAPDLGALPDPSLVWFGHSGLLLKVSGRTIAFDPVLGPSASPLPFLTRGFALERAISPVDLPPVDLLLISHDHWDHLDYPTVMAMRDRLGAVACPLGAGAHFERWGIPGSKIFEGDWGDCFEPLPGVLVHLAEARHFAGRGLVWRRSLWAGFVVEIGGLKIYHSGDGGYGPHFIEAGRRFGGFDLAALECGQYDPLWRHVHMTPEEAVRAGIDLGAKAVLPIHSSRFCICRHHWADPLRRFVRAASGAPFAAVTPLIGQAVPLDSLAGPPGGWLPWWEGRPDSGPGGPPPPGGPLPPGSPPPPGGPPPPVGPPPFGGH